MGGAATAAAGRWLAERRSMGVYVIAVDAGATLWTAAAWLASLWHDWAFWTARLSQDAVQTMRIPRASDS